MSPGCSLVVGVPRATAPAGSWTPTGSDWRGVADVYDVVVEAAAGAGLETTSTGNAAYRKQRGRSISAPAVARDWAR
jgi:hypothetical protein